MAFTLLGTGSALTDTIKPISDTSITAYAAQKKCDHKGYETYVYEDINHGQVIKEKLERGKYQGKWAVIITQKTIRYKLYKKCVKCDGIVADLGEGTKIVSCHELWGYFTNGDVNSDGKVDIEDAIAIINHVNGVKRISNITAQYAANVSESNGIDIEDAVMIINHVNGIKALP